jgi:ribonucleoside-diphosphate reductase beta chain
LSGSEQDAILRQCSLSQAGRGSVTRDLLPLIEVVAGEGRIEEVLYLTSFLWEKGKHVEGFYRFFDEVPQDHSDLNRFHGPASRKLFYEELPATMSRLRKNSSVVAQVRASVTYNLIVEGMLAETGYHGLTTVLTMNDLMPGMQQFIAYLKRDESRHIAFAIYFLSRLVAEHGNQA